MYSNPCARLVPAGVTIMLLAVVAVAVGGVGAAGAQLAPGPLRSYADVAEVASPAVVNISTDKVVDMAASHPFMDDPMLRRFFQMPDEGGNGGGSERVETSLGSGVVISADGFIITNNHVVANADKIMVTFEGDRAYEAEIVGTDPQTDVALIKIDQQDLPFIRIADSTTLRVGDQVMAIGNPFGVGQTVTMGIVSALGRTIGLINYEDLIQTDASINPGNSGGALVNMKGELVGMNSAILSRSGGSQGIGFAIPSSMALRIVDALKTHGSVQRAYLGVLPQLVDQNLADYYGLDRPRGVLISQVNDDTPADRAGLQNGDIILAVDGRDIKNPSMLRNVISLSPVGHTAELEIVRDGKHRTIDVELEKFPEALQADAGRQPRHDEENKSLDGVTVQVLTDRLRSMSGIPANIKGLLVIEVSATSNAAREGLARGDVIREVGDRKVESIDEFRAALGLHTDRPIFMRVFKPQRGGGQNVFLAVPR